MSKSTPIIRTSKGLQSHLFDQLDGLHAGTITPQHARAVAATANTAISLVRLEMDHARFVSGPRAKRANSKTPALLMGDDGDNE